MKNILITRARKHSHEIKQLLQKGNFSTFIEPLFVVKKINIDEVLTDPVSAAIITSANACKALIDFRFPKNARIFVVGKKSAKELIKAGYKNILYSPKNSAASLKELIVKTHQNKSQDILYFHGPKITLDFKEELEKFGFKVRKILSYNVIEIENFTENFLQTVPQKNFDHVLIFSQNSAKIFFKLATKHNLLEYFKASQILCLSDKILEDVKKLGFENSDTFSKFPILNKFYD